MQPSLTPAYHEVASALAPSFLLKRRSTTLARSQRWSTEAAQASRLRWSADRLRGLLLCGLTAVYVARPLLASETPTTTAGDGLPFVMLILILAAVWLLVELLEPRGVRFTLAEGAWLTLLGWLAVSALIATRSGYARAAINGFWEWAGLGVAYLLLRQLLDTDEQRRALTVVLVGVAVVLSLDGLYQFFIELPLARDFYRADPEKMLRESNVYAPPGSTARTLFEQRLASTEPYATFSLANSLAGFLTGWLLVAIAIGWWGHDRSMAAGANRWRLAGAAACAFPMAACLVLTKSRAGYLATLAGFALLVLCSLRHWRRAWLVVAGSTVVASVLIAAGFLAGSLDRQVLSESFKSLSYRWHYWRGAWRIVAEHPWTGCGPGNFQDEYTRFKLPEASEVVADPHNFVFEIWATAGTPALVTFMAVLAAAAVQWRRAAAASCRPTPPPGPQGPMRESPKPAGFSASTGALTGGVSGFVLALAIGLFSTVGLPWPVFAAGCCLLPAVVLCFSRWIRQGALPTYVPLVAALALLVNLLVAGGISFAGVAGSLWLLLAIVGSETHAPLNLPRWSLIALGVVIGVLFIACHLTAYRPMLECRRLIALAQRDRSAAREHLLAATEADPLADEPWRLLADGDFSTWLQDTSAQSATWENEQQETLRRRPHSSAAWQEAGDRYLTASTASQDERGERFLSAAIEHFRQAAELYPNSSLVHAKLSLALSAVDDDPEASEQAAIAIRLHQRTPHLDQKLPTDLLMRMQTLERP